LELVDLEVLQIFMKILKSMGILITMEFGLKIFINMIKINGKDFLFH
jgi:hypothetical protein